VTWRRAARVRLGHLAIRNLLIVSCGRLEDLALVRRICTEMVIGDL
jgi:hypothetical protein